MVLVKVYNICYNMIKIYNDKNIKFFYLNFVEIILEVGKNIKITKNII